MFAVAVAALGFSSCSETWDDNPVIKTHEGVQQADFLNEPVMKDQVIMLTDQNREGVFHMTCSQPDFGYAAVGTYKVQISLTEDFKTYEEVSQDFYDCGAINVLNGDVASILEKLSGVKTEDDLPLPYQPVYMRLRAYVAQDEAQTTFISNVVKFKGVSADYLAIWVSDVPIDMYLRGARLPILPGTPATGVPEIPPLLPIPTTSSTPILQTEVPVISPCPVISTDMPW